MSRFIAELARLYFLPGQAWQTCHPGDRGAPAYVAEGPLTTEILAERLASERDVGLTLVSPNGMVRTMVISFDRGGYWEQLAALYQGVQEDLDVPAPAISVSVEDGYQVWFSLAEPVPLRQAQSFLNALRRKYLADIPVSRLKFRPGIEGGTNLPSESVLPLMPAQKEPVERWSAFIDPSMGSMFIDEPWLEMAPSLAQQAAMLAGVESIQAEDFQRVLSVMPGEPAIAGAPAENAACSGGDRPPPSSGVGDFSDPKHFLMAIMNDPHTSVRDRIEAAKALLPYFDDPKEK